MPALILILLLILLSLSVYLVYSSNFMEFTEVSMAPPRYDPRFFFVFSCLKDLPRVGFRSLLARSPQDPRAFFCTYNNIALYRAGRMPRVGGGLIVGMYYMCVLLLFVRGEKIALQTVSILTGYGLQIK